MLTTSEFLKNKVQELTKKIESSVEYKEIQYLEELLLELGETKTTRDYSTPKKCNPTGPRTDKIKNLYEAVYSIISSYGEEMEIDKIRRLFSQKFPQMWQALAPNELDRGWRLTSYVESHNKRHPKDQKIFLWPLKEKGKKKSPKCQLMILKEKGAYKEYMQSPSKQKKKKRYQTPETKAKIGEAVKARWALKKDEVSGQESFQAVIPVQVHETNRSTLTFGNI